MMTFIYEKKVKNTAVPDFRSGNAQTDDRTTLYPERESREHSGKYLIDSKTRNEEEQRGLLLSET